MQFILITIVAAFATSAYATPTGHTFMRRGCEIAKCVAALAPSVVSCVSAAAQEGLDPISDAACLASAANSIVNFPPSCDQCAQEFNVAGKVEDATNAVGSAASKAEGAVESVVGDVGNVLGSIF
ncbi:hypothetical protein PILCRDRAFT_821616 [Piloderma croceum F 1598]|uniref:Fungal calcium binding protein domain-containing protein n=1 Tax=Piloderma croceum (strain F 1598) TaxID=765440 RepID=A0A0C3FN90_PILCF|nr:hypothetical protein PILCRDRAFT_821616 [Piloderma croceum F 1598]